jgi:hypothetical protein
MHKSSLPLRPPLEALRWTDCLKILLSMGLSRERPNSRLTGNW